MGDAHFFGVDIRNFAARDGVFFTEQLTQPLFFSTYILFAAALAYFSKRIALDSELRQLQRLDVRLPLKAFFEQFAQKHSMIALLGGFLLCIAFVAYGASLVVMHQMMIGIFCVVFFSVMSVGWFYSLILKRGFQHA